MDTKKSVMKMTPEEITRYYNMLFENTKTNQGFSLQKHDGVTFKKASILEDTRISYSTSAQA